MRWKLGKRAPRRSHHAALDAVRPQLRPGGAEALATGSDVAVWIGHATWAFRMSGQLVVTDPIWSRSISGAVPRLSPPGVELDAMPRIDEHVVGDITITFVPARHWSMRMPWNRSDALSGGFVVRGREGVAYHAGDTAWGEHFAEIRARCGAIDWAMLPIGGYAPRWFMEAQHIDPVEAGRAFDALGAQQLFAMHWGTFRLTDEAVGEPVARLLAWWAERGLPDDRLWIADLGEPRALTRATSRSRDST